MLPADWSTLARMRMAYAGVANKSNSLPVSVCNSLFQTTNTPGKQYWDLHFREGETKAQREKAKTNSSSGSLLSFFVLLLPETITMTFDGGHRVPATSTPWLSHTERERDTLYIYVRFFQRICDIS